MPTSAAIARRTHLPEIAAYPELLRRVRRTFLAAKTKIEQVKIRAYWEAGREIHNHCLHQKDRAQYGEEVLLKLSGDLGVKTATIYRALRLYEAYPIFAILQKLTLSHYYELAKIPDPKKRLSLETRAEVKDWTVEDLRDKIQKIKSRSRPSGSGKREAGKLLQPKKGRLGVYQIVADGDGLAADFGFTSYSSLAKPGKLKEGDFIGFSPSGRIRKIKKASVRDLFTYEVGRWGVVDLDTIWFQIWHKRPLFLWEKLRLRGIDAPELSTAKGRAGKRFLERLLKKAVKMVIATTKPDKWDRYLSDLFVTLPDGAEVFVNNLLLTRGLARRYDKIALEDWEAE